MSYLATRLAAVKPSVSMAAILAAKALRAEGHDVIDLGLAEPDFPTPAHVAKAAHAAARRGDTLYAAAAGTLALRTALAEKFRRENRLDYGPDDIVVTNGAKQVIFDGREFASFGKACANLRDRILIVNGVAKAYAMTGWRVGYAVGPAPLLKAMTTVQSQSVTSVAAPMEATALAALTGPQDCVAQFREAFQRRRDLVAACIARIPGLTLPPPEGAFYACIGCAGLIGKLTSKGDVPADDTTVSAHLLDEARVGSVPGTACGVSPFFRISTAKSDAMLIEAIARVARAVANLTEAA